MQRDLHVKRLQVWPYGRSHSDGCIVQLGGPMQKTLSAITAAAAVAAALTLAPADAFARPRGGAVAAGIIGGLAAGAIIGGALAGAPPVYAAPPPPPPAYAPVGGYAPYPAYAAPYPVGCPGGYWARRPLYDPYGEFMGYSRPRFFCP